MTSIALTQRGKVNRMDDLISRADALSCFHDWIDRRGDVHTADEMPEFQRIEQLPSAQPNVHESAKDADCIDRAEAQTAIQFAARRYTVSHEAHGEGKVVWSDNLLSVTDAMNALREVPSAQPEPKTGKWIIKDNPGTGWYRVTCSECGEDVTSTIPMIGFFPNAKPLWDYCPYCGCKTEVEE